MSSFTSPLIVELTSSGRNWRVFRRFTYRIGKKYSRKFINIPTGFLTDFASIEAMGKVSLVLILLHLISEYIPFLPFWVSVLFLIPVIIYLSLPRWAKFNKPSPLHDYLYRNKAIMGKPITRKRADDVFYEAMLVDFRHHKSGKLVAWLEYWGVRTFAWMAWR